MRILVTGGFGNVGMSVIRELLDRGHDVVVFELDTKRNRNISRRFKGKVVLVWGDL
ncbi:MAG: NAD-dependent epimerase/dehydratase family protein, partial [Candidatus Lokiarchaeota archaeon]|nr:NAD-dependent epimerase/dehydratase family protein [Candidatus Lokiarchaeota archaeon]